MVGDARHFFSRETQVEETVVNSEPRVGTLVVLIPRDCNSYYVNDLSIHLQEYATSQSFNDFFIPSSTRHKLHTFPQQSMRWANCLMNQLSFDVFEMYDVMARAWICGTEESLVQ